MTLWTIQTIDAWEVLQKEKVLRTDPAVSKKFYEDCPDISKQFQDAYQWLIGQMEQRIGPKPEPNAYPLWAWYQWYGTKKRRPDLRCCSHLPSGHKGVRIEFEHPEESVLLSDFQLWSFVIGYFYLPLSEEDDEIFSAELSAQNLSPTETKPLPVAKYHRRIQKSWEKIFDLNWVNEYMTEPYCNKSIQATFWQLHIDQIKKVDFFTAR